MIGRWVEERTYIREDRLEDQIHSIPAEGRWLPEDQDKVVAWVLEKRHICKECGTRHEEWDPDQGGDLHAYYAVTWTDLGCKAQMDAIDAARENSKDADGKMGNLNGLKVRLIPKEQRQRESEKARIKRAKELGKLPEERQHIPFMPFP